MTNTEPLGRFIVFEGPDGVGKSTQAAVVAQQLGAQLTREPGGSAIGQAIRNLLLDHRSAELDHRAEALLMAADRAQHVATVVRPTLAAGRDVVSDRYLYSSVAYQGYGRELGPAEIARISHWATGGLEPDVVVFLDAPDEVLAARRRASAPDRLEAAGEAFFARVNAGYRAQLAADPTRWVAVDGSGTVACTTEAIWHALAARGIGPRG